MSKNTFKYFAYGSNMLTERLQARCNSATKTGGAQVTGFKVMFTKKSIDKSGKATLVETGNESDTVHGIVFDIDNTDEEKNKLNEAEGSDYEINENFPVIHQESTLVTRTYIAPKDKCVDDLPVFGWYAALVVAGAKQHEFDDEYIKTIIETIQVIRDKDDTRKTKLDAIEVLKKSGYFDKNILQELIN